MRGKLNKIAASVPIRRILDVGCGDGLFFDVLEHYGAVDGLEPDSSLILNDVTRDRIKTDRLDANYQPAKRYDLIVMLDVLEHIEDDGAALRALRRGLTADGRLLMTVPANPQLWSRHDEVNQHHRRYTKQTLRETLKRGGFQVLDLHPFFAWTVAPMLLRKWLAPARGDASEYSVTIPIEPINSLLAAVSRCEQLLTARLGCPFGSSLFALAKLDESVDS